MYSMTQPPCLNFSAPGGRFSFIPLIRLQQGPGQVGGTSQVSLLLCKATVLLGTWAICLINVTRHVLTYTRHKTYYFFLLRRQRERILLFRSFSLSPPLISLEGKEGRDGTFSLMSRIDPGGRKEGGGEGTKGEGGRQGGREGGSRRSEEAEING